MTRAAWLPLVLAISGVSAWALVGDVLAQDAASCVSCHDKVMAHPALHGPLNDGNCTSCHDTSPSHLENPAKDNVTTTPATIETCGTCHPTPHLKANVHKAIVEKKQCSSCHDPHGGEQHRFFLREASREQCISCHKEQIPTNNVSEHGFLRAQSESCLQCHNPHSSDNPKLVNGRANELCLSCHNKRIDLVSDAGVYAIEDIAEKVVAANHVHDPVTKTGCVECHNPHGSRNPNLLVRPHPGGSYAKYEGPQTYELCLKCHSGILEKDLKGPTAKMTKFRKDREVFFGLVKERKNLHWFHVVEAAGHFDKSRGRSCTICHDAHGTTNAHGVAEGWNMSKDPNSLGYYLRLKYQPTPKGGSCTLCHEKRESYERIEDDDVRKGR